MNEALPSVVPWAINPCAQFDHHVALCAFGGIVIGGVQALVMGDVRGLELSTVVLGWSVLGALHGPLLWPMLARRAWWTTSVVLCSGVVVAAAMAGIARSPEPIFLGPLVALWLATAGCWRFTARIATPGLCCTCDYDLRGLPAPRCPECGTPFGYADERAAYRMACLSPSNRSAGINPHSLNETVETP